MQKIPINVLKNALLASLNKDIVVCYKDDDYSRLMKC